MYERIERYDHIRHVSVPYGPVVFEGGSVFQSSIIRSVPSLSPAPSNLSVERFSGESYARRSFKRLFVTSPGRHEKPMSPTHRDCARRGPLSRTFSIIDVCVLGNDRFLLTRNSLLTGRRDCMRSVPGVMQRCHAIRRTGLFGT